MTHYLIKTIDNAPDLSTFDIEKDGVPNGYKEVSKEEYYEYYGLSDDTDTIYDDMVRERMYAVYPQDRQNAILMKALIGDMTEFNEMKAYQESVKAEVAELLK